MKRHESLGAVHTHTHTHTPILIIKNAKSISAIFRDFQKNKEPKKAYNIQEKQVHFLCKKDAKNEPKKKNKKLA